MDWDQVRRAADGRWFEILATLGVESGFLLPKHGPCPGCGGKDRFRFADKGRGEWFCGQGGETAGGDGFALLGHVHGWDKGQQLAEVARVLGIDPDRPLTEAEKRAYAQQRAAAEREREARERGRHVLRALERVLARYRVRYADPEGCVPLTPEPVRARARAHWGRGTALEEGSMGHPYLLRKNVRAWGGLKVHASNGTLMVPVRQVGGQLVGLQFLPADPAGSKTFLKDMAPMAGSMHLLGEVDPTGYLGIAEGYATAATIHEQVGLPFLPDGYRLPVAVAWSTAGLEPAGRALLARWPRLKLLWIADWDDDKPSNPGVSAASWAAEVCGGLVLPAPGVSGAKLDWNDALVAHGAGFVRDGWHTMWECARDAARAQRGRDLEVLRGLLNHGL